MMQASLSNVHEKGQALAGAYDLLGHVREKCEEGWANQR